MRHRVGERIAELPVLLPLLLEPVAGGFGESGVGAELRLDCGHPYPAALEGVPHCLGIGKETIYLLLLINSALHRPCLDIRGRSIDFDPGSRAPEEVAAH